MNSHAVLMRILVVLGIVSLVFLAGCGSGTSQPLHSQPPPPSGSNPVPTITSLSLRCPATLEVAGSSFVAGSVLQWNGSSRPTTVSDSGDLTAQLSASDIGTAAVTVFNPPPGGGSSNSLGLSIGGGVGPLSITVDPPGKFAYVANEGCGGTSAGSVSIYTINPTTGVLSSIGARVTTDFGRGSITVDPLDRFAYVARISGGSIPSSVSAYTINSTSGALTFTGTISGPCQPLCPWSVTVDPTGKFVYVPNGVGPAPTSVSIFNINPTTGMLSSSGSTNVAGRAVSVSVHPSGKFAYVASASPGDDVYLYTVNTTTGALSSIRTFPVGSTERSGGMQIAIHPSGKFMYVVSDDCLDDVFNGSVSMFRIDASTGVLTSIGSPVAGDGCARSLSVDPLGKFAYVTNPVSNNISMYAIDPTTGALTPMGTEPAESGPTSIAIHPSGKFAYVTNSGSNNVSMYSIDATTGALTLIGTIGA